MSSQRAGWVAAAVVAAARALCATEPSVEFDVQPRVLRVGEVAVVTIAVRNAPEPGAPALPDLDGFQLLGVEPRTEIRIVNGIAERTAAHRFHLKALRAGEHVIGPFRYAVGGREFDLPAIRVSVAPAPAAPAAPAEARVMTRLTLSKSRVYVHERFTLTIELLSNGVEMDRQVELADLPQSGLKISPFAELPARREIVDGQVFEVRPFQAEARALSVGDIVLAPRLRARMVVRRRGRGRDPFFGDSLFEEFFAGTPFDRAERQSLDLSATPVTLTVWPLPAEGRPESFSGAVGACSWDVDVRPTELAAGEPVTITMTIRGDASLETVQAPPLRYGPEFRVYEPRLTSRVDPAGDPRERVFEQIVIPRDDSAREIPALSFSYFDPETGTYRTLTRGPFPLVVRPITGATAVVVLPGAAPRAPAAGDGTAEIEYLKATPSRLRCGDRHAVWFRGPGRWVHAAPVAAAALLAVAGRRRARHLADAALALRSRALRAALPAVRRMREAVKRADAAAFYEALWEALTVYFGHRLNLAPGEVDADRVVAAFGPAVEEPVRQEVQALFDAVTSARFGGSAAGASDLPARLQMLQRVLSRCEKVREI